ncbi:hypothetical protein K470DRAFT_261123 [Piedraia hortae CBS 480.64]|uniref:Uncharacterized protein n=1 Tax=Piedraia hortae CBS 480.64 TaxID=1314780 RepID=A0A6A7BP18_9PEZI|nr:hypothetical protein K470DRAFT_261123 [Piedraia hortae CBS 480.64]
MPGRLLCAVPDSEGEDDDRDLMLDESPRNKHSEDRLSSTSSTERLKQQILSAEKHLFNSSTPPIVQTSKRALSEEAQRDGRDPERGFKRAKTVTDEKVTVDRNGWVDERSEVQVQATADVPQAVITDPLPSWDQPETQIPRAAEPYMHIMIDNTAGATKGYGFAVGRVNTLVFDNPMSSTEHNSSNEHHFANGFHQQGYGTIGGWCAVNGAQILRENMSQEASTIENTAEVQRSSTEDNGNLEAPTIEDSLNNALPFPDGLVEDSSPMEAVETEHAATEIMAPASRNQDPISSAPGLAEELQNQLLAELTVGVFSSASHPAPAETEAPTTVMSESNVQVPATETPRVEEVPTPPPQPQVVPPTVGFDSTDGENVTSVDGEKGVGDVHVPATVGPTTQPVQALPPCPQAIPPTVGPPSTSSANIQNGSSTDHVPDTSSADMIQEPPRPFIAEPSTLDSLPEMETLVEPPKRRTAVEIAETPHPPTAIKPRRKQPRTKQGKASHPDEHARKQARIKEGAALFPPTNGDKMMPPPPCKPSRRKQDSPPKRKRSTATKKDKPSLPDEGYDAVPAKRRKPQAIPAASRCRTTIFEDHVEFCSPPPKTPSLRQQQAERQKQAAEFLKREVLAEIRSSQETAPSAKEIPSSQDSCPATSLNADTSPAKAAVNTPENGSVSVPPISTPPVSTPSANPPLANTSPTTGNVDPPPPVVPETPSNVQQDTTDVNTELTLPTVDTKKSPHSALKHLTKVPYRVGLSRRQRIPSLLRSVKR